MRKLFSVLAVTALLLGIAGSVQAGIYQPKKSLFFTGLGGGPQLPRFGNIGPSVTVADDGMGGHTIVVSSGAFSVLSVMIYEPHFLVGDLRCTTRNPLRAVVDVAPHPLYEFGS